MVDASIADLAERLGADRVLSGPAVPPRYRLDALRAHRGTRLPEEGTSPLAVVLPRSAQEVSLAVRLATDAGISVVPWGGGTGLMGGARPVANSIVLDLRRMGRVRAIDRASCTATAESGIILETLDRRLRRKGLTLGHDPWSRPRATLGGAIGTNGIGYGGYLRGTMGDQVLGLEIVLADGTIVRTRAAAHSTTGLDLKRLFIGTEGTLGVVTAATIRAFPVPEREDVRAFELSDFPTGFACVSRIYDDGLVPCVMDLDETFPASSLPWTTEAGPPTLYLGFAGKREIVAASWRVAAARLRRSRARRMQEAEARTYWRTRHDIIYHHDEVAPGVTSADRLLATTIFDYAHVALPRSKVIAFRRSALAIVRRHGVTPIGFGVWTQPELASLEMVRPVRVDREAARAAVADAIDDVLRRALALGGSMDYVHGVGVKLVHLLGEELGEGLALARRVKRAVDPKGTLNPGKSGY